MNHLTEKIESLKEMLSAAHKVVVVSHTNPDGDAIGSSLAWSHVLEHSFGLEVSCIIPNRYPGFLSWQPHISEVLIYKDSPEEATRVVSEADIIFCLDFNLIDRLENLAEAIKDNTTAKRVLIDHHLNPPAEFDLAFSHPELCSTSYLVYTIVEDLVGTDALDTDAASNLYVGIMTDTGNFSFSSLTPDLFRAVAVLVEKGIDISAINTSVYNTFTEDRVRLLGHSLCNKMTMVDHGRAAYISLTEREMRKFNFQLGDSEGFVNYPLTIVGVKISAMFLATRKFIRVSLRSRGETDVNIFARRYFGGGGHKNAAGGKSFVSMAQTVEYFERVVKEYLAEGGKGE